MNLPFKASVGGGLLRQRKCASMCPGAQLSGVPMPLSSYVGRGRLFGGNYPGGRSTHRVGRSLRYSRAQVTQSTTAGHSPRRVVARTSAGSVRRRPHATAQRAWRCSAPSRSSAGGPHHSRCPRPLHRRLGLYRAAPAGRLAGRWRVGNRERKRQAKRTRADSANWPTSARGSRTRAGNGDAVPASGTSVDSTSTNHLNANRRRWRTVIGYTWVGDVE
jgi:hypothetical protein